MQPKLRTAGALCAALALAAAACTEDPGGGSEAEGPAAGEVFEEDRLLTMVNESNRLLAELENTEQRIVLACLDREGFDVHDQFWFDTAEPVEEDALYNEGDWGNWLPTSEEAAMYGLGMWAWSTEGASDPELEAYSDYAGLALGEDDMGGLGGDVDLPDNSAFEALAPEDQYAWYVAFYGEATAIDEVGYLLGEDAPEPTNTGGDEEIDLGGDFDYVQPEPGGCQREMIDALYGDPQLVEDPEGQEYRSANWSWRPVNPIDDFAATDAANLAYEEALAPVKDELLNCLEGKGRLDWEFDEEGYLP
nr:hypothetical protein GCM10025732_02140 [Glycomyces mayteni]